MVLEGKRVAEAQASKLFRLTFDSAHTEEGEWLITCHLRFRVKPRTASMALERARAALIAGFIREGKNARARGATRFKVKLDTTGPEINKSLWNSIGDLDRFL